MSAAKKSPSKPPSSKAKQSAPAATAKPKNPRSPKQKKAAAQAKKLSALDAAAKVLAETGQAMNCQELIAAMASKGYWTSPGGKTPSATLYSAVLRELAVKGTDARFVKTERGRFAWRQPSA
jgi:vancomycin resistance protein YoaR